MGTAPRSAPVHEDGEVLHLTPLDDLVDGLRRPGPQRGILEKGGERGAVGSVREHGPEDVDVPGE